MTNDERRQAYDHAREQLTALDSSEVGRKLRNKLTRLAAYCCECHGLAFAVVATEPYWVLRTWETSGEELANRYPSPPPELELSPAERGRWTAQHADLGAPSRRDAKAFSFVSKNHRRYEEDGMSFTWTCDCRSDSYSMRDLWAELDQVPRDGKTRRITLL